MAAIYTFFAGLVMTGWAARIPAVTGKPRMRALAGRVATGLIGAMFVGTHAGQLSVEVVRRTGRPCRCGGDCVRVGCPAWRRGGGGSFA